MNWGLLGQWNPGKNQIIVNLAEVNSPQEIVSTLIHEGAHQTRSYRGFSMGTQYEEYFAFRRELMFDLGRRPTLSERYDLWNNIRNTEIYAPLPVGQIPVKSW